MVALNLMLKDNNETKTLRPVSSSELHGDDNLCPILRQCMKTPYKWWLSSTVTMIPALLVIMVSIHWLSFSGLNLMPKLPWNILGQLPIVVMVTVLQLVPCPHLTVISQPTLKMTVRKKKILSFSPPALPNTSHQSCICTANWKNTRQLLPFYMYPH